MTTLILTTILANIASPYISSHQAIDQWYQEHGRHDLPWRNINDPYPIYISEVMLQQTQVKTVLARYYHPFLQQFPTLSALAHASLNDVLTLWQGLGYYNRARYLHQAAQLASPHLPQNIDALLALPGIGKNTAHAIACFGFKQDVPILDANIRRILYRFFALEQASPTILWDYAWQLFNPQQSYNYNQAMMDIGSVICTSKNPNCTICPLAQQCNGKENPLRFPKKTKKRTIPVRTRHIVVWKNQSKLYITQRQTRFLHGLYGFSEYTAFESSNSIIGHVLQRYSHFTLDATIYMVEYDKASHSSTLPEGGEWVEWANALALPCSEADRKIFNLLKKLDKLT